LQNARFNGRERVDPRSLQAGLGGTVEAPQDEYILSINDPFRVIWKRLWLIVLVVIASVGFSLGYTSLQTPTYTSSAKVLLGVQEQDNPSNAGNGPGALSAEAQGLKEFARTAELAIQTRPVAEAVVERLDLSMSPEEVLENLSAKRIEESPFIEISYESADPEEAQRILATVGDVFSERVQVVSPASNSLDAIVWEEATVPTSPTGPDLRRNVAIGLVVGGFLGLSLAFLVERLDYRWHSLEEVEELSGTPTFASIPRY
jgi:capsular polysaccharide biosynthesis protein